MSQKLRILIVDDDQRMAKTLMDILTVKGFEADMAFSGPEALEKINQEPFGCVLSDIKMPGMNGVDLYKSIKQVRPHMPVVLMTAYSADNLVEEGLREGAIASLTKPLDLNNLLSFFSMLRKDRSIVIVDDDPNFCKTMGDILRARGFEVAQITDPVAGLEMIETESQVVLLDIKLRGVNGVDLLKKIRDRHPNQPVILVTGYREEAAASVKKALEVSAVTCLYKPLEIENLLEVLDQVHRLELGRVLGRPIRKGGVNG